MVNGCDYDVGKLNLKFVNFSGGSSGRKVGTRATTQQVERRRAIGLSDTTSS